jgi:hypothetical protein
VVSFTSRLLYRRYPLDRSLGGPRADLDDLEKGKFLTLPGLELWSLCHPPGSQHVWIIEDSMPSECKVINTKRSYTAYRRRDSQISLVLPFIRAQWPKHTSWWVLLLQDVDTVSGLNQFFSQFGESWQKISQWRCGFHSSYRFCLMLARATRVGFLSDNLIWIIIWGIICTFPINIPAQWSLVSSVGIATGYWLDGRSSIPGNVHTGSGVHPVSYPKGTEFLQGG